MKIANFTRRQALKGAMTTAAAAGVLPLAGVSQAFGGAEEDRIIAAAKKAGGAELGGMIWSNYYVAMSPFVDEFTKATGTTIPKIQDISIFDIPQRAMAEALSKSPEFEFFHVDSNMIPSLASAGLLEPLDEYMEEAGFSIDAVGDFAGFMKYKGQTYGMPTDGNVFVAGYLWEKITDDVKKKYADMRGKEFAWPETWEDELAISQLVHDPDSDFYGTGDLRNRANGVTWWYQYFYSAGGFPFDEDMNPTLNNAAGEYAMETYLNLKTVGHPEAPGWGTPQMIPRWFNGQTFGGQYWDGIIAGTNNPNLSKTAGKFRWGLVPGSTVSGKLVHRSISSPIAALLVNRHSPKKRQMAYLAMYMATANNSSGIVGDPVNTFHDPWHKAHFEPGSKPETVYTAQGMAAIQQNLQITTPPIYLTGFLEFQDQLAKNLSEAYTGVKSAKDVLTDTEEAWKRSVRRIGKRKLRDELASYKAVFPSVDRPV